MDEYISTDDKRVRLKNKLRQNFDGKIVRKDLTKKIKEGANVPVYVLEFLLGQYCSSDDDEIIDTHDFTEHLLKNSRFCRIPGGHHSGATLPLNDYFKEVLSSFADTLQNDIQ